jgi:hypothetical protein
MTGHRAKFGRKMDAAAACEIHGRICEHYGVESAESSEKARVGAEAKKEDELNQWLLALIENHVRQCAISVR